MEAYFFFISLKYVFPLIFYLIGGKTYQPAIVNILGLDTETRTDASSLLCGGQ